MNNNKKNFLDNKPNQPSKFKTKNWVEINDKQNGVCNIGSQVKFKTSVLRSSLRDYNDVCIFVKGTTNTGAAAAVNNRNKNIIFKNCPPFNNWITETNNKEIDLAKDM